MTPLGQGILDRARRGERVSAEDVCGTITSPEELAGYEAALREMGALDAEALAAIVARRMDLAGRRRAGA